MQVIWLLLPKAVEFGAEGEDQLVDRPNRLGSVPTRWEARGEDKGGGREEEEERRKSYSEGMVCTSPNACL